MLPALKRSSVDAFAVGAMLTSPPPSEAQKQIGQSIRQSALRMSALVSNLLDMARLEAGAVQLNRQWLPLEEVTTPARRRSPRRATAV